MSVQIPESIGLAPKEEYEDGILYMWWGMNYATLYNIWLDGELGFGISVWEFGTETQYCNFGSLIEACIKLLELKEKWE